MKVVTSLLRLEDYARLLGCLEAEDVEKVDVAQYAMCDAGLVLAVMTAHERGVVIRFVIDLCRIRSSPEVLICVTAMLEAGGCRSYRLTHCEILTIHKRYVDGGSRNWTPAGYRKNEEMDHQVL